MWMWKSCFSGLPGTRKHLYYTRCKIPGYINLASSICECGKFASFGYPATKKNISSGKCKLPNIVNLSSRTTLFRKRLERNMQK